VRRQGGGITKPKYWKKKGILSPRGKSDLFHSSKTGTDFFNFERRNREKKKKRRRRERRYSLKVL